MRQNFHRHAAHRGDKCSARAVHIVDIFAADDRAYRKLPAQHAELQIDTFLAVKALFNAVNQRRDADAFTRVGDENFFLGVSDRIRSGNNKQYGDDK